MWHRVLILIIVTGSLLAMATTAGAVRMVIPACEEILTVHEAQVAMGERVAFILNREVRDDTRTCAYAGGSKAAIAHGLGVNWGPYADFRKRGGGSGRKSICAESKAACQRLKDAVNLRRDRSSFAALADALDLVGTIRRLPPAAFDGNPAFVWTPSDALPSGINEAAWVFVYDAKSAHMLQVLCADIDAGTPDSACAIAAAKRAYKNVT
jgi:hypothetical protein